MKIGQTVIEAPQPIKCEIYRESGTITFICGPVLDYSEFEALCPEPKPPLIMVPNKPDTKDTNSPVYRDQLQKYGERRTNFLYIKSLGYTPDLTWDTVSLDKPDTWANLQKEMSQVLTQVEVYKVLETVFEANAPTKERRQQAMENFTPTTQVV